MPFVQRILEPRFLSRRSLHREDGSPLVSDGELEAVSNNTLSSALRQLASLALIANDIFVDLSKQLQDVCERSKRLQARIAIVEQRVEAFDPRKIAVPESDLTAFSQRTEHFTASRPLERNLFTPDSRPNCVKRMYESASKTPVPVMRTLDRYREDGRRSSRFFLCTPVLGRSRRRYVTDTEIETRLPAAVNELRRWTSEEALGDMTVGPDCSIRIEPDQEVEKHRLPSPEEQVQVVAHHFPAQVIAVDVSGRAFDRMSSFRRSLIQTSEDGTSKRRTRRTRGRRRNTIAGTDQRELEQAILTAGKEPEEGESSSVVRSASTDLLRSKKDDSPSDKKSHFNTLKQWGKVKLKFIRGDTSNKSSDEPTNIYEIVAAKGKKVDTKHDRKQKVFENTNSKFSESTSTVKLREGLVRRRALGKEDPLHSSSGNWSASSESGRASIGSSETNTATTLQPKSTTTSSNSLSHHQAPSSTVSSRRKFPNTSASSSVSEGTLTPDLVITELVMPFPDDGETSSVYSCDTEGYYTSFHMDSGLKTLKEEEATSSPQMPLQSTGISNGSSPRMLTAESEYELFGKGSTSTTTSSAGTVCTTLLVGDISHAPAVPERKSSLDKPEGSHTVVALIHKQEQISESPDSGHNTSSSPIDSTSSPPGTLNERSSEYEFSESDLEGVDRLERIRVKTTINSSRIPSMCIITPPQSDDEFLPSYVHKNSQSVPCTNSDKNKAIDKAKLEIQPNQNDNTQINYNSLPRRLEKQNSKDSERSNEAGPSKFRSQSASRVSSTRAGSLRNKIRGMSPSPTRKAISGQQYSSLQPLNSVLDKVKGVISSASNNTKVGRECSNKEGDNALFMAVDAGDYVTIADMHNIGWAGRANIYHPPSNSKTALSGTTEYISLNELPASNACSTIDSSLSPSNSLERKRRQGARVTLDSEGKVVYSSDSLRRNKGAHTTFEPGPYVKNTLPNSSPLTHHRITKSNIRPVISQKDGNKPMSPTSPLLGKVIIKAASKTAPMTLIASPPLAVASRPTSPKSALSGAGRGAYVHMQSPAGGVRAEDNDEGYSADVHTPPRYVSSPPAQPQWSAANNSTAYPQFRTLPARRPAKPGATPGGIYDDKSYPTFKSKFNTIAVSKGTASPPNHSSHMLYPNYLKEEHLHHSPLSIPERERRKSLNDNNTPVSQNYSSRSLYFSTPTKKDELNSNALHFSSTISPIRKPKYDENNSNNSEYNHKKNTYPQYNLAHHQPIVSPRSVTPDLVSVPKTKMTSEEIFAAIHKSKKKLNIKTDPDTYPSASSLSSISPASSLSRLDPEKRQIPETGSFQTKTVSGEGWSSGSNDISNIFRPSDQHPTKQGWAYDRLGPRQQLSRNDFKRLLLQCGAKSNINIPFSNNSGRLSAVEQLKMTRQLGNMQEVREIHSPSSTAHKSLQSPRSNTTWKFSSPRTDILSSTIVEDCAEEENASNSPINMAVKLPDLSLESSLSGMIYEKEIVEGGVSSLQALSTSTSQQNSIHLVPSAQSASSSKYIGSYVTQEYRSPCEMSKPQTNHFATTLLSSSNVKENLDTNLQYAAPSATLQAPSPRISTLLSKQWTRQCSPQQQAPTGRTILGAITSSKSSPKTTLETAL